MSLTNWSVDEVTRKANSGKKENSDESASTADDRKKSKKNEIAPILSEEEYFSAFQWCSVPWALARVDGRFCDCNEAFSRASGFSRNEVLSFTIFNLINPVDLQDTFRSDNQHIYLSVCLPICLSIYLSNYLSVCLSLYLSAACSSSLSPSHITHYHHLLPSHPIPTLPTALLGPFSPTITTGGPAHGSILQPLHPPPLKSLLQVCYIMKTFQHRCGHITTTYSLNFVAS